MGTGVSKESGYLRVFRRVLIAAGAYLTLTVTTFAACAALLRLGVVISVEPLRTYQRIYYFDSRVYWQRQPTCVAYDPELLYVPKLGECKHETLEFKTTLNFDKYGRLSPHNGSPSRAIAVVGDSHAMGWGVNDSETFAARLEVILGRNVYNLAVSSYGTYRELLRLEKSGLLDKVDTVIIQYCDNDLYENLTLAQRPVPDDARPTKEKFQLLFEDNLYHPPMYRMVANWILASLKLPILWMETLINDETSLPERFFYFPGIDEYLDFRPHFEALNLVFSRFSWLRDKRVILFYANSINGGGIRFKNYLKVVKQPSSVPVIFLDLEDPRRHFVMDDHLSVQGHLEIARNLAEVIDNLEHSSAGVERH